MLAEMGSIVMDIVKTGACTIVISKASKSFGQKEISEIVGGLGWLMFGVNIARLFVPFYNGCLEIDRQTQGIQEVFKMLFKKDYLQQKVQEWLH